MTWKCEHWAKVTSSEKVLDAHVWVTTCARCGEVLRVSRVGIVAPEPPSPRAVVQAFLDSL